MSIGDLQTISLILKLTKGLEYECLCFSLDELVLEPTFVLSRTLFTSHKFLQHRRNYNIFLIRVKFAITDILFRVDSIVFRSFIVPEIRQKPNELRSIHTVFFLEHCHAVRSKIDDIIVHSSEYALRLHDHCSGTIGKTFFPSLVVRIWCLICINVSRETSSPRPNEA